MTAYHSPFTSVSTVSSTASGTDLATMTTSLNALDLSAQAVSKSLTAAFSSASSSGKGFEQVLASIASKLAGMALSSALKGKDGGLTDWFSGLMGTPGSGSAPQVTPFAAGGIVSAPTYFGAGGGLGVMGERGAEAIMPLARGPDGALGLAMREQGRAVQVTVNISTPDAESFRRSDQQISSSLARAVSRGQRGL